MKKSIRKSIALGVCAAAVMAQTAALSADVRLASGGCGGKGGCGKKHKANDKVVPKRNAI